MSVADEVGSVVAEEVDSGEVDASVVLVTELVDWLVAPLVDSTLVDDWLVSVADVLVALVPVGGKKSL